MLYEECADEGWSKSMGMDNCTRPLFEPLTFTDTTYYMIVLMTTTGYGDQGAFVQSTSVMWFTCFYVIYGVAMVLTGIMIIAEAVAEKAEAAKKLIQQEALREMFESGNETLREEALEQELKKNKGTEHNQTFCKRLSAWAESNPLQKSLVILFAVMFVGQMFMSQVKMVDPIYPAECYLSDYDVEAIDGSGEAYNLCETPENEGKYTFTQSLYWAVVTGTTVGFGDLSPETDEGKWFCVFYLPCIVLAFVNFIGAMQSMLRGEGSLTDILSLKLDKDLINQLDKSGDGEVSKDEWLRAMMIALGKADEDLCDLICEHFDNLDSDKSGTLDVDDLSAAVTSTNASSDMNAKAQAYNKAHKKDGRVQMGALGGFRA